MAKHKSTIAIDFDGVINKYDGWKGYEHFDKPLPGARGFLEELQKRGYEVVIHTARNMQHVEMWFEENGMSHLIERVSNHKPPAIAYVDDRAVRFNGNYAQTLEDIKEKPWWKK